jgi:hypothetical protein
MTAESGHADDAAKFANSLRTFIQRCLLLGCELDLNDLLDSPGTELAGDTNVEAIDSVLTLQVGGARKDFFLILQDRFDHLDCGGRRSVIRRASLQVFHDLSTTVGRAFFKRLESRGLDQFGDGNTGDTWSSSAMKVRKRAESSTPAIPMTRSRGKPAFLNAV